MTDVMWTNVACAQCLASYWSLAYLWEVHTFVKVWRIRSYLLCSKWPLYPLEWKIFFVKKYLIGHIVPTWGGRYFCQKISNWTKPISNQQSSSSRWSVIEQLSSSHRAVVNLSSSSIQAVFKQFSSSRQAVAKQLSSSQQAVSEQSSSSHFRAVKQLLSSHWAVIEQSSSSHWEVVEKSLSSCQAILE